MDLQKIFTSDMKWLIYVTLTLATIAAVVSEPPESEKQALVDFFQETNGKEWDVSHRKNWLNDDVSICQWEGVMCNDGKTHVIALYRRSTEFMKGSLPKSFSQLEYLESLDLSNNKITGDLELLSDMPLRSLDISRTDFDKIPTSWSELRDTLEELDLRELQSWTPGPLPPFSSFPKLHYLNIGQNSFTGDIPAWIGDCPLKSLLMDQTQFGGLIPDTFFNLRSTLEYLDMSEIPATPAPIPSWIGEFKQLGKLSMNNFQRTGKVPDGLWMLIQNNQLTDLSLARNHLTGDIPSGYMNRADKMRVLDISDNQFSGTCPITQKVPLTCNTKNVPWKCPISNACKESCQGGCS